MCAGQDSPATAHLLAMEATMTFHHAALSREAAIRHRLQQDHLFAGQDPPRNGPAWYPGIAIEDSGPGQPNVYLNWVNGEGGVEWETGDAKHIAAHFPR